MSEGIEIDDVWEELIIERNIFQKKKSMTYN